MPTSQQEKKAEKKVYHICVPVPHIMSVKGNVRYIYSFKNEKKNYNKQHKI